MNTIPLKRAYNAPEVEAILLDNEISLILTSNAPDDPEGGWGAQLIQKDPSPFKETLT
jgi:hypothetical protein